MNLRLRIETACENPCEAVSIRIPEDILKTFKFITGPKYEGNLLNKIRMQVDAKFEDDRIISSLFTGRLRYVYCDRCKKPKLSVK